MTAKRNSGYDGISVDTVKFVIPYGVLPITNIINHSFCTGLVPDDLKIAKVCPSYKNGDRAEISNYRPISVLPRYLKNWFVTGC